MEIHELEMENGEGSLVLVLPQSSYRAVNSSIHDSWKSLRSWQEANLQRV